MKIKTPTLQCMIKPGDRYDCTALVESRKKEVAGAISLETRDFTGLSDLEIDEPVTVEITGKFITFRPYKHEHLTCEANRKGNELYCEM